MTTNSDTAATTITTELTKRNEPRRRGRPRKHPVPTPIIKRPTERPRLNPAPKIMASHEFPNLKIGIPETRIVFLLPQIVIKNPFLHNKVILGLHVFQVLLPHMIISLLISLAMNFDYKTSVPF